MRTWSYLFQFRDAGKVATGQYRIRFDLDNRVVKTRWDKPECETFGGKGRMARKVDTVRPAFGPGSGRRCRGFTGACHRMAAQGVRAGWYCWVKMG